MNAGFAVIGTTDATPGKRSIRRSAASSMSRASPRRRVVAVERARDRGRPRPPRCRRADRRCSPGRARAVVRPCSRSAVTRAARPRARPRARSAPPARADVRCCGTPSAIASIQLMPRSSSSCDTAVAKVEDPVGAGRDGVVVGDQQQRALVLYGQPVEEVEHEFRRLRVEVAGGFVGEDDTRRVGEGRARSRRAGSRLRSTRAADGRRARRARLRRAVRAPGRAVAGGECRPA